MHFNIENRSGENFDYLLRTARYQFLGQSEKDGGQAEDQTEG